MWIKRRWQSGRHWFDRRSWWSKLLVACLLITSPVWLGTSVLIVRGQFIQWFVYTVEDREFFRQPGYRDGVPSVARRLKSEMESIDDPETAVQLHPDWYRVRFNNREWVFGLGIDSHWFGPGEGTVVVKDSSGRVRIFFGHVCGHNGWALYAIGTVQTLNEFYANLTKDDAFREWVPGQ